MPTPFRVGMLSKRIDPVFKLIAAIVMYEVELKFPLTETRSLLKKLEEFGAVRGKELNQRDRYFNHPSRDFRQTDEALRIRRQGSEARITYKGPVVDSQTKTRREIEIPIGRQDGDDEKFAQILNLLGFREVRAVCKKRVPFDVAWEDRRLELALDDVEGLGRFLEIETMADENAKDAARDCILRLARKLGLENSERRSYLSLLMAKDQN